MRSSPLHCGEQVEPNEQGENERERDGINVKRESAPRCGGFVHGNLHSVVLNFRL